MTPAQIQAELVAANVALAKSANSWPYMVRKYGADWTKWPKTTQWYIALNHIKTAHDALSAPTKVLTAAFEEVTS